MCPFISQNRPLAFFRPFAPSSFFAYSPLRSLDFILNLKIIIVFWLFKTNLMTNKLIQDYTSFVKKNKLQPIVDVAIFGIITVFFHFLWWNGLKSFLLNFMGFQQLELFLAHQVFLPAAWVVENILQYPIKTVGNALFFENNGYVEVVGSCSGLKQFYQWTILILLFPGPWKKKLWFIPMGLLVIHIVNILRIVILSVVTVHWPDQWDFIHLWVLRPFFYVVIFALWMIWEEKFRLPALARKG